LRAASISTFPANRQKVTKIDQQTPHFGTILAQNAPKSTEKGSPKKHRKKVNKKDGKSYRNGAKTAIVGSPGEPKIVKKSMKNRAWDRPGVVGSLFAVPGWP